MIKFQEQISVSYWEVFDPYDEEDLVLGNLADDFRDIAIDLKEGMFEYNQGRIGNAVFKWKLGLNTYWGQHIIDALRVLHVIRSNSFLG